MNQSDIDRFWSKVQKTDSCWLWIGGQRKNSRGNSNYGTFCLNGKDRYAHRISYLIAHNELSDDLDVLHRCDNTLCVNPDHLWVGTHTDNMQDMFAKGRRKNAKGEQNGLAKLKANDVKEIRQRYSAGGISLKALALEFGVDTALVHRIVRHEIWKSVE
jgi:hypothetical protein